MKLIRAQPWLGALTTAVKAVAAGVLVSAGWGQVLTTGQVIGGTPGPLAAGAALRLDPLVVTGTRTAQRLSETPIRTEVLSGSELRWAAPRCLADAMELLPGARVENNCQNCGTSEILLLGLEQKYTQILFDGAALFSGLAGVYGIEQIPALFIDRIEVVKGGGSSIYGSGAVGGVINIIARQPERTGLLFDARLDHVKGQPSFAVGMMADYVSGGGREVFSVYGQSNRTDPVDLNSDGFSDLTKRRLSVVGARFQRRTTRGELRIDFNRTTEFRRGGNKFELPDPLADISERIDTRRDAASVVWTGIVSAALDYQVSAGGAHIQRETFYGGLFGREPDEGLSPESAPGLGDNDQAFLDRGYRTAGEVALDQFGFTQNRVTQADVQVNRRWGRHLTSWGAHYSRETINDHVPVSAFVLEYPVMPTRATGDNVGAFVQNDWRLSDTWQFVAGVRADKNSELSKALYSPRFNLKWSPGEQVTLRATWASGFRAPQAFDEDLHIELLAGNRTRTVQAPELGAEKSRSALVSVDYQPRFSKGRLAIEATAFLTQIRGTFTQSEVRQDAVSGDAFRLRYNGPNAEIGGMELNLGALPLPSLRIDMGYVAQFARFAEPVTIYSDGEEVLAERDFLESPRHYSVLQVTYLAPRAYEIGLNATYTGAMKVINHRTGVLNARTRDFVVWNAGLSRTFSFRGFRAVTVSCGVKNLFDARQSDLESGVDRDPYYLYGPRTPRTFHLGCRLEF